MPRRRVAGARGPTGRRGATGQRGPQGQVGATGPQGATGPRGMVGSTGAAGPAGPRGPKVTRRDVLAAVANQFRELRGELTDMRKQVDLQRVRMGQIQQQLDSIQKLVAQSLQT